MHRREGKTSLEIPMEGTTDIKIDCLIPEVILEQQAFTNDIQQSIMPYIQAALDEMQHEDPFPANPFEYLKAKLGFIPAQKELFEQVESEMELEILRYNALLSQVIRLRAKLTVLEDEQRARDAAAAAAPAPPEEPASPLSFNPAFKEQWDRFFVPK